MYPEEYRNKLDLFYRLLFEGLGMKQIRLKDKAIKIESCGECPFRNMGYVLMWCSLLMTTAEDPFIILPNCPLGDAEE